MFAMIIPQIATPVKKSPLLDAECIGVVTGVRFYDAMTDHDITGLFGSMFKLEFGWGP